VSSDRSTEAPFVDVQTEAVTRIQPRPRRRR
jgi:hypothetical protein